MGSRRSAWQIGRTHWSSDVCSSDLDMDRFLDAQLKRLNTSRIDYYLVPSLNGGSWDGIAALGVADREDALEFRRVLFRSRHGPLSRRATQEAEHLSHRLLPRPLAQRRLLGWDRGARRGRVSRPGPSRRTHRECRFLVSRIAGRFPARCRRLSLDILPDSDRKRV